MFAATLRRTRCATSGRDRRRPPAKVSSCSDPRPWRRCENNDDPTSDGAAGPAGRSRDRQDVPTWRPVGPADRRRCGRTSVGACVRLADLARGRRTPGAEYRRQDRPRPSRIPRSRPLLFRTSTRARLSAPAVSDAHARYPDADLEPSWCSPEMFADEVSSTRSTPLAPTSLTHLPICSIPRCGCLRSGVCVQGLPRRAGRESRRCIRPRRRARPSVHDRRLWSSQAAHVSLRPECGRL
jgi:hypothetical protein